MIVGRTFADALSFWAHAQDVHDQEAARTVASILEESYAEITRRMRQLSRTTPVVRSVTDPKVKQPLADLFEQIRVIFSAGGSALKRQALAAYSDGEYCGYELLLGLSKGAKLVEEGTTADDFPLERINAGREDVIRVMRDYPELRLETGRRNLGRATVTAAAMTDLRGLRTSLRQAISDILNETIALKGTVQEAAARIAAETNLGRGRFKAVETRATLIASFAMKRSEQRGVLDVMANSGYGGEVEPYVWITMQDRDVCARQCAPRHGVVRPLKEWHKLGIAPLHSWCRCYIIPKKLVKQVPDEPIVSKRAVPVSGDFPSKSTVPDEDDYSYPDRLWKEMQRVRGKIGTETDKETLHALRRERRRLNAELIEWQGATGNRFFSPESRKFHRLLERGLLPVVRGDSVYDFEVVGSKKPQ
jgi:hypothetical protein